MTAFADHVERADRAVQAHLGGVAVVYQPQHEDPVEVTGIFDPRFVLLDEDQSGVEQTIPALFVRVEDLPVHPDDDEPTIKIGDVHYTIAGRRPDGQGGIHLLLHRAEEG